MKPILPCLIAALALAACTPLPPDTADTAPPTETAPDTADLRLAYYEALVAELNQTVLELRETDYITRAEYEARIQALHTQIRELQARLNGLESPEAPDIPVSGTPDPAQDYRYTLENGQATLCAYLGTETHVTVPRELNGCPVTAIADHAFRATGVERVTLPDTLREIGWFAFAHCPGLTAVTLPPSVESIGYGAFDGCPALTLRCAPDSYAEQYAVSFGLSFTYIPSS